MVARTKERILIGLHKGRPIRSVTNKQTKKKKKRVEICDHSAESDKKKCVYTFSCYFFCERCFTPKESENWNHKPDQGKDQSGNHLM